MQDANNSLVLRAQEDSKRVVSWPNQADFISFRHHTYEAPRGAKSVRSPSAGRASS